MPWWGDMLLSVAGAVLITWFALVIVLWRSGRGVGGLREAAKMLPDLVRLVSRLARDPDLPRTVRWSSWLVLTYLASPVDLIPDFVPVAGYADDAVVVSLVLRAVVRRAGTQALERHWPGSADGLLIVRRLAGVSAPLASSGRRLRP
jgi:uncharacterized membrane protein YkvA (DUF1232 family)